MWMHEDWRFRIPVAVDNVGGASTIDVGIAIPGHIDEFWDNVLATGNDIRVTGSDGKTKLTYKLDSWDHAARSGNVHVDGWSPNSDDATVQAFLYWGKAGASSEAGSFTVSSAKTGSIIQTQPRGYVLQAKREAPGTTKPSSVIHKTSTEKLNVFVCLSPALALSAGLANGSNLGEEVESVAYRITDSGTPQAGMIDQSKTRLVEDGLDRYARVRVKAGSANSDYTLELTLETTTGQTLEYRYLIKVRNPGD
tara:strand:- start:119 stop:874 length:756 start_codon:yes stop_codon:yes gene_type:complete